MQKIREKTAKRGKVEEELVNFPISQATSSSQFLPTRMHESCSSSPEINLLKLRMLMTLTLVLKLRHFIFFSDELFYSLNYASF